VPSCRSTANRAFCYAVSTRKAQPDRHGLYAYVTRRLNVISMCVRAMPEATPHEVGALAELIEQAAGGAVKALADGRPPTEGTA
jgi:hypothetical protein